MVKNYYCLMRASLLAFSPLLQGASTVYNFRIAQITKQPILDENNKPNMTVALLFDQYQKQYNGDSQNFVGGLGSYIRAFHNYYIRLDGSFAGVQQKQAGITTYSGTQTDDLLATFGRDFIINKKPTVVTISGLLGVPTHGITAPVHAQFGYAQAGVGAQLDGSCGISTGACMYGLRYLYFIPRTTYSTCPASTYTAGNLIDMLIAGKNRWNNHILEIGFTQRFQVGGDDNYLRSAFYTVYKYNFFIRDIPNRVLLNLACAFDDTHHPTNKKYVLVAWTSWNISF